MNSKPRKRSPRRRRPSKAVIDLLDLQAIRKERCRRNLYYFVQRAWPILEPITPFVPGRHIEAICNELQQIADSDGLTNLVINIPPRHMKSLIVSVIFPVWLWIRNPGLRILSASYSLSLATRDCMKSRALIQSDWFQQNWSELITLKADNNQKTRYENTAGGLREIASPEATTTGLGGDILIVDDPLDAMDAHSDTRREACLTWYKESFENRLNSPTKGARICVMQRLHENDLSGYMLSQGYKHLCLPAEYSTTHPFRSPQDWRTTDGELLWPEQFPQEVLDSYRQNGSTFYAGQYQQLPAPEGGTIIKSEWLMFWEGIREKLPPGGEFVQSWDLAFDGKADSDYVVGQVWYVHGADYYLVEQVRGQWDFPATIDQFLGLVDKYKCSRRYVERKANGAALIDSLKHRVPGIIAVSPTDSKIQRVYAVSSKFESGNVYLPQNARWVESYVYELTVFPAGAHDDQVDATTQLLSQYKRAARLQTM